MKEWESILIDLQITILRTIEIINKSAMQIVLVVDENKKLLGTVTDGDIRRGILKGIGLDQPVSTVMNTMPTTVQESDSREQILLIMRQKRLRQVPVIDAMHCVVGLETIDGLLKVNRYDNCVVLMAGGLGSRLGDLTKHCPKPLISVGGKPLLETIVENFKENGFYNFIFCVNYKAEMIVDYFTDGADWDISIKYLIEKKRLGTAGALSLLEQTPDKPIIVMNGDLLTKVNFQQLLDYHVQHKSVATMCVREYSFQVPYGVVRIENGTLKGIDEKPVQDFFVSAGIYVIEPKVLDLIPKDTYYDMPSLFDAIIQKGLTVNVFPIREYWLDIGHSDDLKRAQGEYEETFR